MKHEMNTNEMPQTEKKIKKTENFTEGLITGRILSVDELVPQRPPRYCETARSILDDQLVSSLPLAI